MNLSMPKDWEETARKKARQLFFFHCVTMGVSLISLCVFLSEFSVGFSFFQKSLLVLFGIGGLSTFHLIFQRLWNLWAELHDRVQSSNPSSFEKEQSEESIFHQSTIKVVFSSENENHRKKHLPFLEKHLPALSGCNFEIIEQSSLKETLSYLTDHIVHLVILDSSYAEGSCLQLSESIKKLDKNIPVVVCSQSEKQTSSHIDAWFSYLQRESDLRQLLPYFLARRQKTSLKKPVSSI